MLPTKFQVNWFFSSGEGKIDQNNFCCFWSTSHPDASYQVKSIGLSVQEKWKIDFQDGRHLGFSIETILAIFELEVTSMLPTKFQQLAFRFRKRIEK